MAIAPARVPRTAPRLRAGPKRVQHPRKALPGQGHCPAGLPAREGKAAEPRDALKQLASALIQNRTSQTAKQKELLELDNAIAEQRGSFMQALQTLRSSTEAWQQRYILRAPVAGKVSFASPWQEQQSMSAGQELLTVEPAGGTLQGLVKVPQTNLGKLREGQAVLIKLDAYPYREYGMVEGTLSQLSLTPGRDSVYWGYVELPLGLRTRQGRTLTYRNGMKGTAEIITADRRLAERLVEVVKVQR